MGDERNKFSFERYAIPTIKGTGENGKEQPTSYVGVTDAYANNGFVLSFFHLPSAKSVYFKAFITSFNETYNSDWAAETVYGRADPIYMFKNTQRKITLAFKIPAASAGEAYENLAKVQTLVQFLYPTYTDISNANTISQSPLMRLKVMNLASSEDVNTENIAKEGTESDEAVNSATYFEEYSSDSNASLGLLGVVNNLTVNHNIDNPDHGVIEHAPNTVLPKLIEVNLDFSPIHEHTVGWEESSTGDMVFADERFPYHAPEFEENDATAANAGAAGSGSFGASLDADEDSAFLSDEQTAAAATAEEEPSDQAAQDSATAQYDEQVRQATSAGATHSADTAEIYAAYVARQDAAKAAVAASTAYDADE
jgi:hypothetical protein